MKGKIFNLYLLVISWHDTNIFLFWSEPKKSSLSQAGGAVAGFLTYRRYLSNCFFSYNSYKLSFLVISLYDKSSYLNSL